MYGSHIMLKHTYILIKVVRKGKSRIQGAPNIAEPSSGFQPCFQCLGPYISAHNQFNPLLGAAKFEGFLGWYTYFYLYFGFWQHVSLEGVT